MLKVVVAHLLHDLHLHDQAKAMALAPIAIQDMAKGIRGNECNSTLVSTQSVVFLTNTQSWHYCQ